MPKRSYSAAGSYRYGFNGKENDNDVKGLGNQQDYGMRIYDARVGRFLSVDPIAKEYPQLTPFQFASNTPIWGGDADGLELEKYLIQLGLFLTGKVDESAEKVRNKQVKTTSDKIILFGNGMVRSTPFGMVHQIGKQIDQAKNASPEDRKKIKDEQFKRAAGVATSFVTDFVSGRPPGSTTVANSIAPTIVKAIEGDPEASGELVGMTLQFSFGSKISISRTPPKVPLSPSARNIGSIEGITIRSADKLQIREFISTEEAAQGTKAISEIQSKINTNDLSVWAEPIVTTTYKGKTYILDGHNRLKVISTAEKPPNVSLQELSLDEARIKYPEKLKDIESGKFNKKISEND